MIFLYAIIVLAICIFSSIGIDRFFDYKKIQLEYEKANGEQTTEISVKALELEIEKEKTKQMELDSNAFRTKESAIEAKERTIKAKEEKEQLRIKSDYKDKYNERLF